jgi:hypothetical protein
MDHDDVARQTQVEHQMLQHIMEGVRITVGWQVEGTDATRKLSTLSFMLQSFQRHLERLLALEEHEGYMDLVPANDARLARIANALKGEHQTFRSEAHRFVQRLERMQSTDLDGLAQVCSELLVLLKKIDAHSSKELALLHEAFGQDSGGGG